MLNIVIKNVPKSLQFEHSTMVVNCKLRGVSAGTMSPHLKLTWVLYSMWRTAQKKKSRISKFIVFKKQVKKTRITSTEWYIPYRKFIFKHSLCWYLYFKFQLWFILIWCLTILFWSKCLLSFSSDDALTSQL